MTTSTDFLFQSCEKIACISTSVAMSILISSTAAGDMQNKSVGAELVVTATLLSEG